MPLKPDVFLESGHHYGILNSFFVPQTHTPTWGLPWIFRLTRKTHPTHYPQKKQGSLRNICRGKLLWPDQIHIEVMIGCGTPIPAKIPDHAIMLQSTPAFLVMINSRCTFDCSMQTGCVHAVKNKTRCEALCTCYFIVIVTVSIRPPVAYTTGGTHNADYASDSARKARNAMASEICLLLHESDETSFHQNQYTHVIFPGNDAKIQSSRCMPASPFQAIPVAQAG